MYNNMSFYFSTSIFTKAKWKLGLAPTKDFPSRPAVVHLSHYSTSRTLMIVFAESVLAAEMKLTMLTHHLHSILDAPIERNSR